MADPILTPTIDALIAEINALKAAASAPPVDDTIIVTNAAELQAALDGSSEKTIVVQPGRYTGNFTLKPKSTKTTVQGLTGVDGRVTPGLAFPQLWCGDPTLPVLNAVGAAHDYSFYGLEFSGAAPDRDLMVIGPIDMTDPAQMPFNFLFDQCYAHGVNDMGHRGIQINAINWTISHCHFSEFVEVGRDSQAIAIGVGGGHFQILDNHLEASGENFMIGGVDPKIQGMLPGPGLISGNYCYKDPAWKTKYPGSVKNLGELKLGDGITIEKNTFENCWVDAQPGSGFLLTVRNQGGTAPWSTVTNIIIRCNTIIGVANFAFNILATDDLKPSVTAENVSIIDNLCTNCAAGIQLAGGIKGLTCTGNVMPGLKKNFLALSGAPNSGFVFTGNFVAAGLYGISGSNAGVGTPSLDLYCPGYVFTGNTIEKSAARTIPYPAGNTIVATGAVTPDPWTCH
jgi:hypothetical protein